MFVKRIICLIAAALMLISAPVSAWEGEEEYNTRKAMSANAEFNMYVLDKPDNAPYYGARLEPRSGVYFGTIAENTDEFKDFSTVLTYVEFDKQQPDLYYPANAMVRNGNYNVMLAWNVTDADIIRNIDSYTDYIERTVSRFASYGKNIYVRFAGEMNDMELGTPGEYIYAFRKVADIVHRYDNLATVWCPIGVGSLVKLYEDYYPGDEYVDWLGISSYQIKYFTGDRDVQDEIKRVFMTGEYAWQTNSMKIMAKFMRDYNIQKPVMISESGVANDNIWGDSYTGWSDRRVRNQYWDLIMEYPQVKMINYFNRRMTWEKEFFNLDGHTDLTDIIADATNSGAYIKYNSPAKGAFTKIGDSATLVGPNIDVFAHAYNMGEACEVEYWLGGSVYRTYESPHRASVDISSLPDGEHSLGYTFLSNGNVVKEGSYTFKKLGVYARFGRGNIIEKTKVNVFLDGRQISFDVQPCIIADRTFIPIRLFSNALGISDDNIIYGNGDRSVSIRRGSDSILLYADKLRAYVNGADAEIEAPPVITDGRTLVPVRFICESFGLNVDYSENGDELNVYLTR